MRIIQFLIFDHFALFVFVQCLVIAVTLGLLYRGEVFALYNQAIRRVLDKSFKKLTDQPVDQPTDGRTHLRQQVELEMEQFLNDEKPKTPSHIGLHRALYPPSPADADVAVEATKVVALAESVSLVIGGGVAGVRRCLSLWCR